MPARSIRTQKRGTLPAVEKHPPFCAVVVKGCENQLAVSPDSPPVPPAIFPAPPREPPPFIPPPAPKPEPDSEPSLVVTSPPLFV